MPTMPSARSSNTLSQRCRLRRYSTPSTTHLLHRIRPSPSKVRLISDRTTTRTRCSWSGLSSYFGLRPASSLHRPGCSWLGGRGEPGVTQRDKECPACVAEAEQPLEMSARELLWERQRARIARMAETDPYELLFRTSNERLRGLQKEKSTKTMEELFRSMKEISEKLGAKVTSECKKLDDSIPARTNEAVIVKKEEDVKPRDMKDLMSDMAYARGPRSDMNEILMGDRKYRAPQSVVEDHASTEKDLGRQILQPATERYAAAGKGMKKENSSAMFSSENMAPAKDLNESSSTSGTTNYTGGRVGEWRYDLLERMWVPEPAEKPSQPDPPRTMEHLQSMLARWKDGGIDIPVKTFGGAAEANGDPLTIEAVSEPTIKEIVMSPSMGESTSRTADMTSSWGKDSAKRAQFNHVRSRAAIAQIKLDKLETEIEDYLHTGRSSNYVADSESAPFVLQPETEPRKHSTKSRALAGDYWTRFRQQSGLAGVPSAARSTDRWLQTKLALEQSWKSQQSKPASPATTTSAEIPPVFGKPSASTTVSTPHYRLGVPHIGGREEMRTYMALVKRKHPFRSMTALELGNHRRTLLKSWAKRQEVKLANSRADEMLRKEVEAQKLAMAAYENKRSQRDTTPASSSELPEVKRAAALHSIGTVGEGDMSPDVVNFADNGRWYKKPAPHALRAELEKMQDRDLVRSIREIYEHAYGVIDAEHRQSKLKSALGEYDQRLGPAQYQFRTGQDGLERELSAVRGMVAPAKAGTMPSSSPRPAHPPAHPPAQQAKPTITTNTLTPAPSEDPSLYQILAYDPTSHSVHTATASSSFSPPTCETALPVSDCLARLAAPAKFLPLLARHQNNGYDVVSANRSLLVLKRARPADGAIDVVGDTTASFGRTRNDSGIPGSRPQQPLQGLDIITPAVEESKPSASDLCSTSTHREPPVTPTGNFASPTGFVNLDAFPHPSPTPYSPTSSKVRCVRKQEAVFSGTRRFWNDDGNKDKTDSWQGKRRRGHGCVRGSGRGNGSAGGSDAGSEGAPVAATKAQQGQQQDQKHQGYKQHRRSWRRKAKRVLFVAGWTAACCYATGVVVEFFRGDVTSSGIMKDGWDGYSSLRSPSPSPAGLPSSLPPSPAPSSAVGGAQASQSDVTGMIASPLPQQQTQQMPKQMQTGKLDRAESEEYVRAPWGEFLLDARKARQAAAQQQQQQAQQGRAGADELTTSREEMLERRMASAQTGLAVGFFALGVGAAMSLAGALWGGGGGR